ncbi:MAG: outer membrane lipoprotein-sorting protein [Vicinamibacterales bacterium]
MRRTPSMRGASWIRPCAVAVLAVAVGAVARPVARQPSRGAVSAESVVRDAQERDTGRDSRAEMRMRLFDRQGRVRERVLTLWTKRGSGAVGDRTLLRFSSPADIRNTGLLVWESPGREDERFLFLPALGRVRRIAGAEKQESFVGSDLSYEDIGGRQIADYTYAFADERAAWTAPDGSRREAWVVESRSKDARALLPLSRSTILKDSLVMVHAESFDRHGTRVKVFDVRRLEKMDGVWTVLALSVTDERARTRTELETTAIRYNVGLTDDDVSRRRLEQVP